MLPARPLTDNGDPYLLLQDHADNIRVIGEVGRFYESPVSTLR